MKEIKEPKFSSDLYPANSVDLQNTMKQLFLDDRGPGELPYVEARNSSILGAIVPFASLNLAGPAAAWAYYSISTAPMPHTYIILSSNMYVEKTAIDTSTWKMPFGYVRVDQELARHISEKGHIVIDDHALDNDPSVELQLPFLWYINQHNFEKLKILPIAIATQDREKLTEIALDIKESLLELGRDAILIAASNFTLYGKKFGYLPFVEPHLKKKIYDLDYEIISKIENLDAEAFLDFIEEKKVHITSPYSIYMLIKMLRDKAKKVDFQYYYTTLDIRPKPSNESMSFASIVFK